jgi:hypothetical protein
MKRERSFILLLVFIVSGAFVLSVYFAYRPGNTQVEIGNGSYYLDDNRGDGTKVSGKEDSTHKESVNEEISKDGDEDLEEGSLSRVDYSYESDDNDTSSNSDSSESNDSGDGGNSTESDSGNQDYTAVFALVSQIETDYLIDLTVVTKAEGTNPSGAFPDSDTALSSVKQLRSALKRGGQRMFHGFYQLGYRISVSLSYTSSYSSVSASSSGKSFSLMIKSGSAVWEQDVCWEYVGLCETIIFSRTNVSSLERSYKALNPSDFEYGTPNFDYISTSVSSTYFFSVEEQISWTNDRRMLYTSYLMDEIPNVYLTSSCPLYRKIEMIQQNVSDYVLAS